MRGVRLSPPSARVVSQSPRGETPIDGHLDLFVAAMPPNLPDRIEAARLFLRHGKNPTAADRRKLAALAEALAEAAKTAPNPFKSSTWRSFAVLSRAAAATWIRPSKTNALRLCVRENKATILTITIDPQHESDWCQWIGEWLLASSEGSPMPEPPYPARYELRELPSDAARSASAKPTSARSSGATRQKGGRAGSRSAERRHVSRSVARSAGRHHLGRSVARSGSRRFGVRR